MNRRYPSVKTPPVAPRWPNVASTAPAANWVATGATGARTGQTLPVCCDATEATVLRTPIVPNALLHLGSSFPDGTSKPNS